MKRIGIYLGALAILALLPMKVFSQTNSGANPNPDVAKDAAPQTAKVTGVVKTARNAPVPRSMVRVIHLPSGRSWVSWTDEDGRFSFPGLPAGRYRLEAKQLGFGQSQTEMDFASGATVEAQLTLHVEVPATAATPDAKAAPETQLSPTDNGAAPEKVGGKHAVDGSKPTEGVKEAKGTGRASSAGAVGPKGSKNSKKGAKQNTLSAAGVIPGSEVSSGMDDPSSADALAMNGTVNRAATLGGQGSFGSGAGFVPGTSANAATGDGGLSPAGQSSDTVISPKANKDRSSGIGPKVSHKKAKQAVATGDATDFGEGIDELWAQQRVSRLSANQMHLTAYDRFGDGVWNARPYNLVGATPGKVDNYNDIFDVRMGGPLTIPHVYDGRQRTFFFLNIQGTHAAQPLDSFTTVPTQKMRMGDFSEVGVPLYDPTSNLAGPRALLGTSIPQSRMDPAAVGMLPFIPLPNLPGLINNFHLQGTTNVKNSLYSLRVLHSISSQLSVSVAYSANVTNMQNPRDFPQLINNTTGLGQSLTLTLNQNWTPRLSNSIKANWTRNTNDLLGAFANTTNIVGALGIQGVSQAPLDWGLPFIHFTNFNEWHDMAPTLQRNQTLRVMDNFSYAASKHTIHAGVDIRWMQLNSDSNPTPRGDFTFTGLMTSQLDANGIPVPNTGFDFADFLLGYPQNSEVDYGQRDVYSNLRSRAYNFYVQDDWRVHPRFAVIYGVRYELTTPPVELFNRLSNLVMNPTATAVAVVTPGQVNPFTGQTMSRSLLQTNPNNWGPRIGIAWRPPSKLPLVVRAGYGIFYNESVYNQLATAMAIQPPFAIAQTLQTSTADLLTLQNSFQAPPPGKITNTVAVDPNFHVGYAQLWNLSLESQVKPNLVVELDYTGTKGTDLDLRRAPNRALPGSPLSTETDRRIPYAEGFSYDTSGAFSIFHGFQLVVRRQTSHGLILQGTYSYGKTIDDSSFIGGTLSPVVVQDENNIAAERGLSAFDIRNQFRGSFSYDLPFGPARRWLHSGFVSYLFRDFKVNGMSTILTGTPYTARVLGNATDNTGTGVDLSQRANQVGDPTLSIGQRDPLHFFNTNAFVVPPPGQFGNAARNTIIGPGTMNFDFSLARKFKLGEGARRELEWRWEVFNGFNTPNFLNLDTVVNSDTFGQVQSVKNMRRMDLMLKATF